ncbi:hypothetical protein AAG570_003835 [Ranatra chinensis]|uniref:Uncharacterized protein n=1 Tax=Ranatra chinensis TaxID=642074 RepID=A0ABD0Y245_9HEMI
MASKRRNMFQKNKSRRRRKTMTCKHRNTFDKNKEERTERETATSSSGRAPSVVCSAGRGSPSRAMLQLRPPRWLSLSSSAPITARRGPRRMIPSHRVVPWSESVSADRHLQLYCYGGKAKPVRTNELKARVDRP